MRHRRSAISVVRAVSGRTNPSRHCALRRRSSGGGLSIRCRSLFAQSMREWATQRAIPHVGTRAGRSEEDISLQELEIPVATDSAWPLRAGSERPFVKRIGTQNSLRRRRRTSSPPLSPCRPPDEDCRSLVGASERLASRRQIGVNRCARCRGNAPNDARGRDAPEINRKIRSSCWAGTGPVRGTPEEKAGKGPLRSRTGRSR